MYIQFHRGTVVVVDTDCQGFSGRNVFTQTDNVSVALDIPKQIAIVQELGSRRLDSSFAPVDLGCQAFEGGLGPGDVGADFCHENLHFTDGHRNGDSVSKPTKGRMTSS